MTELNNRHSRFRGAEWYSDELLDIIVIGAGGIGSWLVPLISRTNNHYIYLYDFDNIDEVNYAGQLFKTSDLGLHKGLTVKRFVKDYCANNNISLEEKYDEESPISNIVFLAPDNIEVRKLAYEKWKEDMLSPGNSDRVSEYLLVDGRLQCEMYEVYFVTKDNYLRYEETLFEPGEGEVPACSYKQTSHFAAMIAGTMVQGFTNWRANIINNDNNRILPFSVKKYGELFIEEIEE